MNLKDQRERKEEEQNALISINQDIVSIMGYKGLNIEFACFMKRIT